MGRWLEILTARPAEDEAHLEAHQALIVGEIAPTPILAAARLLNRDAAPHFTTLHLLRFDSERWEDEDLWLDPSEAALLFDDVRRLRQVGRYEAFVPGLRAERVLTLWEEYDQNGDVEGWLDRIEGLLERASREGLWVHVMQ